MKRLLPFVFGLMLAWPQIGRAESAELEKARQALGDGLPSVALYQLQQKGGHWASPEEKRAADLLLAQALNASDRYAESVALLQGDILSQPEAQILLARALAALNQNDKALEVYQKLTSDATYGTEALIGEATMLEALGRSGEADKILTEAAANNANPARLLLTLADIRIRNDNPKGAMQALAQVGSPLPELTSLFTFLSAKAALDAGDADKAGELLQSIQDPPATLAAEVTIARADRLVETKDLNGAEKTLEKFIDDNYQLPGLDAVFAELDRIYALQGASSGTELRRWASDDKSSTRAALASFYLARSEARNSKVDRSRQLFQAFLQANPTSPLANDARLGLATSYLSTGELDAALQALKDAPEAGAAAFLRGQAWADQEKYPDAAASFALAANTPSLRQAALFNAAVCDTLAGTPEKDNKAMQQISAADPSGEQARKVHLTEALLFAAKRKPEAKELLKKLTEKDDEIGQKARLALAEWNYVQLNVTGARRELQRISSSDAVDQERAQYLEVFLADDGSRDADTRSAALAEAFLKNHPDSRYEPDVRMKLAEILFRRGDYLGARSQFSTVAEDSPSSPLAEKALYLEAQSMARSMDPKAMEEAVEVYSDVVKAGGPLALRAQLAQATLLNALKQPKDAVGILDRILESQTDPEVRYLALTEKGDTLFAGGAENPDSYKQAIAVWQIIASDAAAPPSWSNQALVKMGAAYEKLGDKNAALNCYYSVFSQGQKKEPEYFWFYRAGFDAGSLLESQKLWNEAIAVYEKLAALDGPRAEEARNKVNSLRLENFLWEN